MKSTLKKAFGFILIIIGILAIVTPFTPGGWLIFVGFGLVGFRLSAWEKWQAWHQRMERIHREREQKELEK